jgi:hypothetical protein
VPAQHRSAGAPAIVKPITVNYSATVEEARTDNSRAVVFPECCNSVAIAPDHLQMAGGWQGQLCHGLLWIQVHAFGLRNVGSRYSM